MRNNEFGLRKKMTLIFIISSVTMCVALTAGSFYSANEVILAAETFPAISIEDAKMIVAESNEIINNDDISDISELNREFPKRDIDKPYNHINNDVEDVKLFDIDKANRTFKLRTLSFMIVIIVIGTSIVFILLGKVLSPLENLTEEVKNQNIDDLNTDIKIINKNDEIFRLTEAFNKRNRKIYEAYSYQKNFSANAAHELFTPIAIIQSKLEVFKLMPYRSEKEYNQLLLTTEDNLYRLSGIVDNLLKLSNRYNVDLNQNIDLKGVIEETLFEYEDDIISSDIEILLCLEEILFIGNDTLIKQLTNNLISNSIKYNKYGGKVEIRLNRLDNRIILEIRDTGIGIPEACKDKVLEPFYRVDKSRSRKIGGSGLGLSIVKKIVEIHKGQIQIIDNKPNGTIFTITFYI